MKLPPRHRRWARIWYRIARVFNTNPLDGCSAPSADDRIAALHIRSGRYRAQQLGRPHEELLGQYNAREHYRRENVKRAWDLMSSRIARVPRKPMLPS